MQAGLKKLVGTFWKKWWKLFRKVEGTVLKKVLGTIFKNVILVVTPQSHWLLWRLFLISGYCTSKFNAIELIQLMQITELIKLRFKCHLSDVKYAWMNFWTINLKLTCFSWNSLMRYFLISSRWPLIVIKTLLSMFCAVEVEELSSAPVIFQKWSSLLSLDSLVLSTLYSLKICVPDTCFLICQSNILSQATFSCLNLLTINKCFTYMCAVTGRVYYFIQTFTWL